MQKLTPTMMELRLQLMQFYQFAYYLIYRDQ